MSIKTGATRLWYPAGMRKTTFVGTISVYLWLVLLGLISMPVIAQDAASAAPPAKEAPAASMPSDPKELMLLAAKSNGLTGDDMKPWHLKVSYTLLDENGNATDHGSFEEFWVSEHKFKIEYAGVDFSQTNYGTDKGILHTESRHYVPKLITQVADEFVKPILFSEDGTEHLSFDQQERNLGGIKLHCVQQKGYSTSPPRQFFGSVYCLASETPILRIRQQSGEVPEFVHNNIAIFRSRYLPRDLEGFLGTKPVLKAHIESIETLKTINDADFTPPSDAMPEQPNVTISSAEAQENQLQQPEAIYPPIARAARVQGTVVLQANIGKFGHVMSLRVISGPAMLQQAALDAVRKWVYKPYILDGQPVEVNTTIKLVFEIDPRNLGSIPRGYSHAIP
jgi:TonB family protein